MSFLCNLKLWSNLQRNSYHLIIIPEWLKDKTCWIYLLSTWTATYSRKTWNLYLRNPKTNLISQINVLLNSEGLYYNKWTMELEMPKLFRPKTNLMVKVNLSAMMMQSPNYCLKSITLWQLMKRDTNLSVYGIRETGQ